MGTNPLRELENLGQAIWIDFIQRGSIFSGDLQKWIEEDGITGVTSNPSIFEKGITGSRDYDGAILASARSGKSALQIYESLVVEDIQRAADLFRPVYDRLEGRDGYVSLEVSPHLARDTSGTVAEARRLWRAVDRPNVMIKVPGTEEGLPAIQQLIGEGINVNITLLFSLSRYRRVVEAFLGGLQIRERSGQPVGKVASVASFFLSRIDVLLDPLLDKKVREGGPDARLASGLIGQVAIASAKLAYTIQREVFAEGKFRSLNEKGARPQRLLWASTSTKNPAYPDVIYVDSLIGPETVNTLPLETLEAYRDHGHPALRLQNGVDAAVGVLAGLKAVGIDLDDATTRLEREGIEKFVKSYDLLLDTLAKKRSATDPVSRQILHLGAAEAGIRIRISDLQKEEFGARLWRRDPTLWKSDPESKEMILRSLGWLSVVEKMEKSLSQISDFMSGIRKAGFSHAVHLGMGGSSLAPLALERIFTRSKEGLPLTVLDTTEPSMVLLTERQIPLRETLFVVASKSGTTAEAVALADYFYAKVKAVKGKAAGENFVAITDPETPLVKTAEGRSFRKVFLNVPEIGGRYSALSFFGLVPAALMGLDVSEWLGRASRMVHACGAGVPIPENPGALLGAVLGELALRGRDKVTFVMPTPIAPLGMWLEQLLAESTGKEGKGLLPVAGEPIGEPSVYGDDRLFVDFRLTGEPDLAQERKISSLRAAGHPVVAIHLENRLDIAQEFFRWEIAGATAGRILGINPFDQPNVEESKKNTRRILSEVRKDGRLDGPEPMASEGKLRFFSREPLSLRERLKRFFSQVRPGSYLSFQAYMAETPSNEAGLQALRLLCRDALRVATTVGYGPRYLHSTGQFHKGGPRTGFFLHLIGEDFTDVPIPNEPYSFKVFKRAQALGDLEALQKQDRPVLWIEVGAPEEGLAALYHLIEDLLPRGAPEL